MNKSYLHYYFRFLIVILHISKICHGCQMENVTDWNRWETVSVLDTFQGVFFTRQTADILGLEPVTHNPGLNQGPYVNVFFKDSVLTLETNEDYSEYEENETSLSMSLTVSFRCVGGTSRSLTFYIAVEDTNNNDPLFKQTNNTFEIHVIPPLPPGFPITNWLNEIIARDIDLTTKTIDFRIYDNALFDISNDHVSLTLDKEFKASLTTTTLIRSIPEKIELKISATDVDETGDEPRTTFATVRIVSDNEFELPEELSFTRTFYTTNYEKDDEVVLHDRISLQQGYHDTVKFSLDEDEYAEYFKLDVKENDVRIEVRKPLSTDIFGLGQILLVLRADREHTSGTSATVIVNLPEEEKLQFEKPIYTGAIVDNILEISDLVLTKGYNNHNVSIEVIHGYDLSFAYQTDQNTISLSLLALSETVIEQNTFLNLQVIASNSLTTASTIVTLEIVKDDTFTPVFEQAVYSGTYDTVGGLDLEEIVLIQGYDDSVTVAIEEEYKNVITIVQSGPIINLQASILPQELFIEQRLVLTLKANKLRTVGASAAVVISLITQENVNGEELLFEKPNYKGAIVDGSLVLNDVIFTQGYENEQISIHFISEYSTYFDYSIDKNTVTLSMSPLEPIVIEQNTFLNLQVVASTNRSTASTIVTLEIVKDDTFTPVFERAVYSGTYDTNGGLVLEKIVLTQGYDDTVTVAIDKEYKNVIYIVQSGPVINLQAPILPLELFKEQRLVLTLEASKPRTVGASAGIIISLIPQENVIGEELLFEKPNYEGAIVDGNLVLNDIVLTQGYENEQISIHFITVYSTYFDYLIDHNMVTLSMSPLEPNVIEQNTFLNLQVVASTNRSTASTIVTLEIIKEDTLTPVFERAVYSGTYNTMGGLVLKEMVLTQGYDDTVTVAIDEEYKNVIYIVQSGPIINIQAPILPPELFKDQRLVFTLEASKPRTVGASTGIIVSLIPQDNVNGEELLFEKLNYKGAIVDGNLVLNDLVLTQGYENEQISIHFITVYSTYFDYSVDHNTVAVSMSPLEPDVTEQNTFLNLQVVASTNRSTASTIVTLEIIKNDTFTPVFKRAVYSGTYNTIGGLDLEEIVLTQGYDDTVTVVIDEEYNSIITIVQSGPNFTLQASNISPELFNENCLLLTLEASKPHTVGARAVIFITFSTEAPIKVTVTFSASSYMIRTEMGQTGVLGQTIATADNNESIIYSLNVDNDHLRSRLTITDDGELYLLESADSGVYSFKAISTTTVSQAVGTATVHLVIESLTHTCEDDNIAVAPLIVIDRDEEEPHKDLVVLDTDKHDGCHYTITKQWPANQPWLYLNETRLHARAIDREDPTIAFMALSQIQVELMLHCENNSTRNKRATVPRIDWLGPNDYGSNTWVLGDTIEYNPKKSTVNLIVNDINDNSPIFIGKENEPLAVGYPISHLQKTILPQSLVELQATDADIGKNAAIAYWSLEPELAVSSKTGFVHVKNNAQVTHNKHLTVNATDLYGQGLTGSITLVVKLLDMSNIAVVTIRNAFLEDKDDIVGTLSASLGYEVKTLRADVISEYSAEELETTRNKRNTLSVGASLQIFVYGLIEKEPVDVGKLLTDINSAAATTVTILSLEDHLECPQICGILGRDIGLLAATIVLSILLFILIVAAAVWFFLTRIKARNYDQFSEQASLASQIESLGQSTKTNDDALPRLNKEDLKRSEKRLRNLLNDPIENESTEPSTSAINAVRSLTATDPVTPIITQDKLKYFEEPDNDDEFGEVKSHKRKSTVTFCDNVEKIEHNMDDRRDSETNTSFEIYNL